MIDIVPQGKNNTKGPKKFQIEPRQKSTRIANAVAKMQGEAAQWLESVNAVVVKA